MPAYFNEGVFVEKNAWHNLGIVVSAEEAASMSQSEWQRASGHDYEVVAVPNGNLERLPLTEAEFTAMKLDKAADIARVGGVWYGMKLNPNKKGLRIVQTRDGEPGPLDGQDVEVVNQSLAIIQNEAAYAFAELLSDLGFVRWAGITLRDGAECALTFKLLEPIRVTGDTSLTLPFFVLNWAHDGSGSLRGRSTNIRGECWNTVSAGEAQGKALGTEFSIKHTENWEARVDDAKKAITGARRDIEAYREVMEEFAAIPITKADRELFASAVVLDQSVASVSRFKAEAARGARSDRVQTNVENATKAVLDLFDGPTIPEAHRGTAYGLHMAGVEYLDHVRKANNEATRFGRSLLRNEPAKARLTPLIRDIVSAAR